MLSIPISKHTMRLEPRNDYHFQFQNEFAEKMQKQPEILDGLLKRMEELTENTGVLIVADPFRSCSDSELRMAFPEAPQPRDGLR